jgi:hypothetical protein
MMFWRNTGIPLPDYMASRPGRWYFKNGNIETNVSQLMYYKILSSGGKMYADYRKFSLYVLVPVHFPPEVTPPI